MKNQVRQRNPLRKLKSGLRELHQRHRERHRPSGFGFAFADRIGYLDAGHWDSVTAGGTIFLRRDMLRVIEAHGPANIQPRYALVFRGDQAVAALAAQIVSIRGEHLKPGKTSGKPRTAGNLLRRMIGPAVNAATTQVKERMIVAGNLLSWGFHGIAFSPAESPAQIWPGIAEALYRLRRAERLTGQANFVMVKDLTPAETGLEALRRFSYRPMETEPNMVLQIDPGWRSYDDYLSALDAKYRRNAKDQIKKLVASGCAVETLSDLESNAARLHELYLAVHDNASVRLVTLTQQYLPALARAAGECFRCTVIRRGAELLGFVTSIRDGDTSLAYYIGFDRAAAAEGLPIYLRLLHATVDDAIRWRCKRLSLGRTALEPKAALGAKPEDMAVWLRHRVPALNLFLRGLLGGIPHAEAPERNPFKSSPVSPARSIGPVQDENSPPTVSI